MALYNDLQEQLSGLEIDEEENTAFVIEGEEEEESNKYELCVVGRFLTERNVNVRAMKTKMADIWRPAMGINIKEIEQGIFLFQFYHKDDMNWVLKGGPWSFDNAMLIMAEIYPGTEPVNVPLWHLNMWIQLYDLPSSLMTEAVGQQLGSFFCEYIEYDHKSNTSGRQEYMRVKIKLDVRKPLKRRKKITRRNGTEIVVSCKYERLGDFCFSCGIMTHTERYCGKFLSREKEDIDKEWGSWLRAQPRRNSVPVKSKWLREDGDADWGERRGRVNVSTKLAAGKSNIPENQGSQEIGTTNQGNSVGGEDFMAKKIEKDMSYVGGKAISNPYNGPEEEELNGLQITERKRMRGGPGNYEVMDITGDFTNGPDKHQTVRSTDIVLSATNCSMSPTNELAKLAQQASHQQ